MTFLALVVAGYLLGSCPWGYWLVRIFRHEDIRKVGSGNVGGSNVWRTYGPWLGAPVVVLDMLKGFLPALAGVVLVSHLCGIAAGGAAMLGHWRPLFLGFARGGKMVATGAGVVLAVTPLAFVVVTVTWWTVFLVTRYVSLASVSSALALPVAVVAFGYPWPVIVFCAVISAAVIGLHRPNLRRLRAGTERRATLRRPAQV
jgi:acyl phosphate:glycerol-3-phosphate acyltransferase